MDGWMVALLGCMHGLPWRKASKERVINWKQVLDARVFVALPMTPFEVVAESAAQLQMLLGERFVPRLALLQQPAYVELQRVLQ